MKLHLFALIFVLLPAAALAQPVDRALLASDVTSVDMLIAKAAGEKSGYPVFILENGTLTEDVSSELSALGIKTVILVGGPAVIGDTTEAELESRYTAMRLWGAERTGTAVEVAKYFWHGAECAVLAEDTKDSDADTEMQADASQLAASEGCPLLPVPRGHMPAEVISLLSELGVNRATFVGNEPGEFRTKLAHLRQKEITGGREAREAEVLKEIENRARNENMTLRLIIIAAPHWKHILGHSGHAGRHTLVRIVSSAEGVPRLIDLANTRNITDIRILGHPSLAADIAAQLEASGVNATKISGERAAEVAIKAVRESRAMWEQRRKEAFSNETNVFAKSRVKRQVTSLLNRMENDMNRLKAANANRNDSAAVSLLRTRINSAQSQLGIIKDYITNDNLDTAKRRITKLHSDARKTRWLYRTELNAD